MAIDLPKPIADYFTADAASGPEALAACFTEAAIVKDEGETYVGRAAILQWKHGAASKYTYTAEPFAMTETGGRIVVTSHLVGNFPGSPIDLRYVFVLDGNQIAQLEIAV